MSILTDRLLEAGRADAATALELADCRKLVALQSSAVALRDSEHGSVVTYSPKVFIPLTQLCRNVCHYCTFAKTPDDKIAPYLTPDQVLNIARAGVRAGCHEALFTLGDKPELRYGAARDALAVLGHETTISYLAAMAELVHRETGLLPHVNAGVMSVPELQALRAVSVSQGLMLESTAQHLCDVGGPHYGSPDKLPAARLEMTAAAGRLKIPFTSGILIGIGESRRDRIEALLALRDLNDEYGHIQEIIIQNFRRKPNTRMSGAAEPSIEDLCWTIAVARIIFGAKANIQAPPNLSPHYLSALINAGINDLGGISPVTPDYVNPEAPWPHLHLLARETEIAGKTLVPRLPLYPKLVQQVEEWVDPELQQAVRMRADASGFPRTDSWSPGENSPPPKMPTLPQPTHLHHFLGSETYRSVEKAARGGRLSEREVERLFDVRAGEFRIVCAAADELRVAAKGSAVSYIQNCNINYTNICSYKCSFCAFSKGKTTEEFRGAAYNFSLDEIQSRAANAWDRGAIEVCLTGGIHPSYTGQTYLDICKAIKAVRPKIHIHAFSPLEVWQGAATLGLSLRDYLAELKAAGLGSLPGTAAEILDDEVRKVLCPDKVTVAQWAEVMRTAHGVGLKSTATIMYGHIEQPVHWARHLLIVRDLQEETGGFTEFVPLPFVHMQSPLYRRGKARRGPTFREAVLLHAVARLVLHPLIGNIQTSWVKMGREGVLSSLQAGANDVGGTLMSESIGRAAGARHGQEMMPEELEGMIRSINRVPVQRNTLYGSVARRKYLPEPGRKLFAVVEHA
ncbi:7,8-didemethyl-8-hydroxy-5-deazariboflavin synthase / 5-amino-6-(D-ribitylamino)uracil--L-tyrosine 4-hydroxyphenyl transferase [Georgfuchsia toluolica]|uniref:FO synthase n=1 Tax=Georgfuchsia toluolica TaxID=424218 RepID=A0A916J443_9PROT|nr:5-amino-6-(D-ribitylamino)uracil--L-tyrosine 4-hydroxyphenyl transferase CofH [Georgfuchsia toluolica]CAG4883607.1 7,8-didemethyl-8-hydroxy-5-deazariboflavin synthase / 5-amino-6-(D-ribitylamino)uracil--L-tyrosine 4-hydroxyphenyl transferase [Georgfuchsia toluolica]